MVGAGARLRRRRVGRVRRRARSASARRGCTRPRRSCGSAGTVLRCRPPASMAAGDGAWRLRARARRASASRSRAPPRRGPRTCSTVPVPGRAPRRRPLAAPPRGGDARPGLAPRRGWSFAGRVGARRARARGRVAVVRGPARSPTTVACAPRDAFLGAARGRSGWTRRVGRVSAEPIAGVNSPRHPGDSSPASVVHRRCSSPHLRELRARARAAGASDPHSQPLFSSPLDVEMTPRRADRARARRGRRRRGRDGRGHRRPRRARRRHDHAEGARG